MSNKSFPDWFDWLKSPCLSEDTIGSSLTNKTVVDAYFVSNDSEEGIVMKFSDGTELVIRASEWLSALLGGTA